MSGNRTILAIALIAALAGCSRGEREDIPDQPEPATPAPGSSPAAAEALRLFAASCAMCHGKTGRGDGAMAARLQPPPRDYADQGWQQATGDADIAKIIVEGGAAVGKSTAMPANPSLAGKPEVVAELVKLIRGFGRQ